MKYSKHSKINKTSVQWNPGSQIYLSSKKINFGQKWVLNKIKINKTSIQCTPGSQISSKKIIFGLK